MIWWTLTILTAFSTSLDQLETRKITKAKSANEIERIRRLSEDIRVARLACRLQLQSRLIPSSCYRALALEEQFGLRPSAGARQKLDRKCEQAARSAGSILDLDSKGLSPICRAEVRKAKELLAYKME